MSTEPPRPPFAAATFRQILLQRLLFSAGLVFVTIGAIGMVVPMMPGTIFLILAAWCFAKSSPRFEAWMLNNRYLGPSVVRWRETGAIPLIAKLFAFASFIGSWTGAWYFGAPIYVLWGLGLLFAGLAIFMATRPNG
ncbi:putative uncharacterized protein [Azorhizobium caulinodans ORS 571]|uniref:Transmembrane protein n=1 Tax=Azorhizobium caulinodans (strain ATCC 43989 / DSM 5975 / JCM 20966 / LMG 6465 / NBRC 14845 / NCIMB 13405 / ORS 571) TaxID=438753 RepID=A8I4F3_AZOC5|nr:MULTISPECIES: YbaN family protein [Azorhizobium]TDT94738.1 hypothetical protein DFO45_2492 [Azorhizobium sp. AG788]BAF87722.1 putative uncharacterized protein [Azorhizobium caulinodans ORS 571]